MEYYSHKLRKSKKDDMCNMQNDCQRGRSYRVD